MYDKIKIKAVTYNLKCDTEEGFARRFPLAQSRIQKKVVSPAHAFGLLGVATMLVGAAVWSKLGN
jgi:hypothetical protein